MSFTIGQQSRPKLYLVPKPNFSLFDKKIGKLILANFKSGIIKQETLCLIVIS